MTVRKGILRIVLILGCALFGVVLLFLTMPWWMPWMLPSVMQRVGGSYAEYQRLGYRRFALKHFEMELSPGTTISVERVEASALPVWLWRRYAGGPGSSNTENVLEVDGWQVAVVRDADRPAGTNRFDSLADVFEQVDAYLPRLKAWLPHAAFTNGVVEVSGRSIAVPEAEWNGKTLSFGIRETSTRQSASIDINLARSNLVQVVVRAPSLEARSDLDIIRTNQIVAIAGDLVWQTNRLGLEAQFDENGWWPAQARVQAPSFRIPAEMVRLHQWEALAGNFDFRWATNRFLFNLETHAAPKAGAGDEVPPVDLTLRANGTREFVEVTSLDVSAPWLAMHLSEPVSVSFAGELLHGAATLALEADLSKQPWVDMRGQFKGNAVVSEGTNRYPAVAFVLNGTEVQRDQVELQTVGLNGTLNWPFLNLEQVQARFTDGLVVNGHGAADLENRMVSQALLALEGASGRALLPEGYSYDDLQMVARADGPFTALSHSGQIRLHGFDSPNFARLNAEAEWSGTNLVFSHLAATVSSTNDTINIEASGGMQNGMFEARLSGLQLARANATLLTLQHPCMVQIRPGENGTRRRFLVDGFEWRGEAREISLDADLVWPDSGTLTGVVRGVDPGMVAGFLKKPLPVVQIENLEWNAGWTNGPAHIVLRTQAHYEAGADSVYSARVDLEANAEGVELHEFAVMTKSGAIVSGQGTIPMSLIPARSDDPLEVNFTNPFRIEAATQPNEGFWGQLERLTGLTLERPEVEVSVRGSLATPRGRILGSVKSMAYNNRADPGRDFPKLTDLECDVRLDQRRINLRKLEFLVEGQPVLGTGVIPLGTNYSKRLQSIPLWDQAEGRLLARNAEVAPFARFVPALISPQGRVSLDLALAPGREVQGDLTVQDAATRPILPFGAIHDINGTVRFARNELNIDNLRGSLGGEQVKLNGNVDLAESQAETGLPRFTLKVSGENVPLVRQPELILRSDLDVIVSNLTGETPTVTGTINLRDSFFLSDVQILTPGKIDIPKRRPPYFSVDIDPIANWKLDLRVRGTEFLKVRSTFFRGAISADFHLTGTMQEPLALGEAMINSGQIQFPFANLRVTQGLVSLTSANPYEPQLYIMGGTRLYGYDVRIEVKGTATTPIVNFSSMPSLSSEQIVLMLTAGELPRNELTYSNQQKATRFGLFLGRNLLSKITGSEGATDRLTIQSGEDISLEGKETYSLEYRLTDRWSLVGEYDRFNEFNAGVKWRLFSR